MNFLAPAAFWFAAAIPVVILFYLLKRKRVVKLVSSTVLWRKFLADTQANAPFQKLRRNWLLLLQILLLLLAVLALSRPYFPGEDKPGALSVLILDGSASMQSRDEAPSRFETARREALKWVAAMKPHDQMIVLLAGAGTEVKQAATSDKALLRRAIESCSVSDAPTRLKEAIKLAQTRIRDHKEATIHLFSDGASEDLRDFEKKDLRLEFHRIGTAANNVGIVALDVRAHPEDASRRAVYAGVQNFSTNSHPARVELLFDQRVLEVRALTLAPGQSAPQVFEVEQEQDGIFSVRLDVEDDLAADNQAFVVSKLPKPVKILLVSRGNRFLEKALKGAGAVDLFVASDLSGSGEEFDVVVLDDVLPTVWPSSPMLAIHVADTNWFEGLSKVEAPVIVDWKNTHPLLRYVSFDTVQIAETLGVKAPDWGIALVEAPQTPLIVAGEIHQRRLVWIGFDTLQSTWPLRISFPIFVANAVQWLSPAAAHNEQFLIRPGDPFRVTGLQGIKSIEVTLPDGTSVTAPVEEAAREMAFAHTHRQGVYRVQAGTNQTEFCVSLLDVRESDTEPRAELQIGRYAQAESGPVKLASMELWRWIAMAALAVLLWEWWYYHRRTA